LWRLLGVLKDKLLDVSVESGALQDKLLDMKAEGIYFEIVWNGGGGWVLK